MKKKILLTLSLISSGFSYGKDVVIKDYESKIKNFNSIKTIVEKVPRNDIENELRNFIMKSRPSRVMGSVGHTNAKNYLETILKELKSNGTSLVAQDFNPDVVSSGKMYEDDFNKEIVAKIPKNDPNYIRWKDFTVSMLNALNEVKNIQGRNYIWEKKGTQFPNEVIIIGANYDTLNHDPKTMKVDMKSNMPGADNNGTGVSMLLTMTRLFNQLNLPRTVRVVFFDAEEFGFLGSKAYVDVLKSSMAQNKDEKIIGFINLVMLGNDTKVKDTEKKIGNMKVYLRDPNLNRDEAQKDLDLSNLMTASGKAINSMVTFTPTANGMNSSSHIRFWDEKIPALCFTQNWETDFNPRFHTSDDFVETLNMNTYVNSYYYLTGSILALNYGIVK